VNLNRLSAILEAYGADPERWPVEEREPALALTRSSLPAARALTEARMLDSMLLEQSFPDIADEPEQFTMLHSAIVSAARRRVVSTRFGRWFGFDLTPGQLWPSVAGLALASVLGFAVGLGGFLQSTEGDHDIDEIAVLSPIDLPAIGQ
jgi:hypothetical protein